MNDIKKIGRPRNFDYDDVLAKAMQVFWEKGYDGASVRDLTQAMGITGPSLYSAFGDKRELYLKAIDMYSDGDNCGPIIAFETEDDIATALYNFFDEIIHYSTEQEGGAKGCFLAACAVTNVGQVDGVAERVQASIADTEVRLAARFKREIEAGRLPKNFPSGERAAMMFDLRQGYMFRARAGESAKSLRKNLRKRVASLLAV